MLFSQLPKTQHDKTCEFLFHIYKVYADKYNFKKVIKLTELRKRRLAFTMNYKESDLRIFLKEVKKSAMLFSNVDWFDFDWLCNESNVIKVMEGKYSKTFSTIKSVPAPIRTQIKYESKEF